jgi:hypothetical protein
MASLKGDTDDLVDSVTDLADAYTGVVRAFTSVEVAASRQEFNPFTAAGDDPLAGLAAPERRGAVGAGNLDLGALPGMLNIPTTLLEPDRMTLINELFKEFLDNFGSLEEMLAGSALDAMQGFGDAISDAFQAGVDGSKSMAEAFTDAMLSAISTISSQWADFYFAKALAALGEGFLGNPAGFAAAAKFAAAGAAFSILSGVSAGLASGGAGVGGSAASNLRDSRDFEGDSRGTLTLVLEGDELTLDHNNPKSVDRFARMMEEASGRRVVIRRVG